MFQTDWFFVGYISIGFIAGVVLIYYGFSRLRKKRLMENIPTSKIRSVAMGFAELKGKVKAITTVKSPITNTDCIYYKFLIEEEHRDSKGRRHWSTIDKGSSAIYFYLEDETGKILVDPVGAEVLLPIDHRRIEMVSGLILPQRRRFTEWYIKPEDSIYILGTVKKLRDFAQEREQTLQVRLRQLKQDKEKLKEFDIDKNGYISSEEWDNAVTKTEEEILEQELKQISPDDIVVGKSDIEKTFIISDHSEKELIKKIAIKSYLLILSGFCIIIAMAIILFIWR